MPLKKKNPGTWCRGCGGCVTSSNLTFKSSILLDLKEVSYFYVMSHLRGSTLSPDAPKRFNGLKSLCGHTSLYPGAPISVSRPPFVDTTDYSAGVSARCIHYKCPPLCRFRSALHLRYCAKRPSLVRFVNRHTLWFHPQHTFPRLQLSYRHPASSYSDQYQTALQ